VAAVAARVRESGAGVVPGLAVVDTLKQVDGAGRVLGTVDRSAVVAVQTPQGFPRALLERAHAAAPDGLATDDAGLVERLGEPVLVVPGDPMALKVTPPDDLARAQWLLARLAT
jgi:2-C-methyl-D-erythritol 4-phosphate cytidylyltransferase